VSGGAAFTPVGQTCVNGGCSIGFLNFMFVGDEYGLRVLAWWSTTEVGLAKSGSAPTLISFSPQLESGGMAGHWTPEELLLGAIAGCYTTTFHTLAAHEDLAYTDLEVDAQGAVQQDESGGAFSEITLRARLTIAGEHETTRACHLLEKTQALCLVSRATSVPQRFELEVKVRASEAATLL
jgi:organic hydroperoxide reductase OsmC/OhrA